METVAKQHAGTMYASRIPNEIRKVTKLSLEEDGICVDPNVGNPGGPWAAYIQGPLNTIWESGVFKVEIHFPSNYPMAPLCAKFSDGIFHPNVASDGSICCRMLGDQWSPIFNVTTVLTWLRSMLCDPSFSAMDSGQAVDEATALAEDEAARRHGGQNTPQKLYHYTDPQAIASIQDTHVLKASATGAGGPGVYATSLHPTNRTKEQILASNYGGHYPQAARQGPGVQQTAIVMPSTQAQTSSPSVMSGTKLVTPHSARADFVIELNITTLQEAGYHVRKVEAGNNRDVWLLTKGQGLPDLPRPQRGPAIRGLTGTGSPHDIQLTEANSFISSFEMTCSCTLNKLAHRLLKEQPSEYERLVLQTISTFGQQQIQVARQSLNSMRSKGGSTVATSPGAQAQALIQCGTQHAAVSTACVVRSSAVPRSGQTVHSNAMGFSNSHRHEDATSKRRKLDHIADGTNAAASLSVQDDAVASVEDVEVCVGEDPKIALQSSTSADEEDLEFLRALELSRLEAQQSSLMQIGVAGVVISLSDSED